MGVHHRSWHPHQHHSAHQGRGPAEPRVVGADEDHDGHEGHEGQGREDGAETGAHQSVPMSSSMDTGARKSEVFGLEVDDVSFKYDRIFIRPNEWRDLKTRGSERDVPLWPQLREILSEYLLERERSGGLGTLLFPSHRHEEERMLDNVDRLLDKVGKRAGIAKPRLHAFRHSYTAARIQTLEHGAPVHIWQVARELGHQSTQQIESRYGHLARVTERAETVGFNRAAREAGVP